MADDPLVVKDPNAPPDPLVVIDPVTGKPKPKPTEYPKMLTQEVEVDHPRFGKIKRVVPMRYLHSHPNAGQFVVFQNKKAEEEHKAEDAAPVLSHMEQDSSNPANLVRSEPVVLVYPAGQVPAVNPTATSGNEALAVPPGSS